MDCPKQDVDDLLDALAKVPAPQPPRRPVKPLSEDDH